MLKLELVIKVVSGEGTIELVLVAVVCTSEDDSRVERTNGELVTARDG